MFDKLIVLGVNDLRLIFYMKTNLNENAPTVLSFVRDENFSINVSMKLGIKICVLKTCLFYCMFFISLLQFHWCLAFLQ